MNKFKRFHKIVLIILASAPIFFSFQNCSKVKLKDSSVVLANLVNLKTGSGSICIPTNYTLESFFITNLNVKATQRGLEPDSDGDGMSDLEEKAFGTNPLLRRTNSTVLDSICREVDYNGQCKSLNFVCDPTENRLGFSECDVLALQITAMPADGAGIDSDQDGIPDYLEMRIGSFPNIPDAFGDLDVDQVNNMAEAEAGTSVDENNNKISTDYQVKIEKIRSSDPSCTGEFWEFKLLNLPTTTVESFTDTPDNQASAFGDRYSHANNENVIQYFLKIAPVANPSAKSKTFSYYQKVLIDPRNLNHELNISFDLINNYSGDVKQ